MQIDHINIKASPGLLQKVQAFYEQVLGLETGFRPSFSSDGTWLYAGEKPIVHLSVGERDFPSTNGGHLDHVAFQTADLPSMIEKLKTGGISFRSNYIPELDMTQLFITDPAGTGIEINFPCESGEF